MTDAGTVTALTFELPRVTVAPSAGAAPLSETVAETVFADPPMTSAGDSEML